LWLAWALSARARVAVSAGEPEQAERDARDALACAAEVEAYLLIPDILECLAALAGKDDSHREATRLFAAAENIRQRIGAVRFKIYDADYQASVAALQDAMGDSDFESAWAEGAALSVTRRSPTHSAAAASANDPPTAGHRSPQPNATLYD
jgi:hypothetical protein